MAGTRLFITVVFLTQLLCLAGVAFYFGLCRRGDMACVPLNRQGGRENLSKIADLRQVPDDLPLPLVTVAVPSVLGHWVSMNVDKKIHWKVEETEVMQRICANTPILQNEALVDLYVCGGKDSSQAILQIDAKHGIGMFHTSSNDPKEMEKILPEYVMEAGGKDLELRVLIDEDAFVDQPQVSKLMEQVEHWVQDSSLEMWPCIDDVAFRIQRASLLSKAVSRPNTTERTISVSTFESILQEQSHEGFWSVSLYLSGDDCVEISSSGQTSRIIELDNQFLSTLDTSTGEESFHALINVFLSRCMGMPRAGPAFTIQSTADVLSIPRFYWKMWHHQLLEHMYSKELAQLKTLYHVLVSSDWRVPITPNVLSAFEQAVNLLGKQARSAAAAGRYQDAVRFIVECRKLRLRLERSPGLSTPIDLSRDHYAGIFVPLMIPLLLPTLLSFVREVKRYRDIKARKEKKPEDVKQKLD